MKRSWSWTKEFMATAVVFIGVFAFRSSVAEPYVVPTGSMEPSILPGDRLLVLKAAYNFKVPFTDISLSTLGTPKRGDVIVFRYPVDPKVNFVKRLMGLPGDEIEVQDGNVVKINGAPYNEAHGNVQYTLQRFPHSSDVHTQHFKVPQGSFFFMGDNRDRSSDSRYWGFVPESYLKGKVLGIWLSLDSSQGILPKVRWERFGKSL